MTDMYILDGKEVVACDDILEWGKCLESADRIIAKTEIGDSSVSTVFMGLGHRFGALGEPLVFETMIFGGHFDGELDRYSTWDEAEAGHKTMVDRVRNERP